MGSVGADNQSPFRADPNHLKPYVADGKPVERARGSAAENPNSALTIVYGHYFCPTQDQVFVCPHQKIAYLPDCPANLSSDNQFRQRQSNLCDYRPVVGRR